MSNHLQLAEPGAANELLLQMPPIHANCDQQKDSSINTAGAPKALTPKRGFDRALSVVRVEARYLNRAESRKYSVGRANSGVRDVHVEILADDCATDAEGDTVDAVPTPAASETTRRTGAFTSQDYKPIAKKGKRVVPLLRMVRSSPHRAPFGMRARSATRRCLEHDGTILLTAIGTALYLIFVLVDVVLDDLYCNDITAKRFLEVKDAIVVRVDVVFLGGFLAEVLLRMFALGSISEYMRKWMNAIDLLVIILGLATDIAMLLPNAPAPDFMFMRLVRLVRIMRIATTLRRFLRDDGRELGNQFLARATVPPRCNWRHHERSDAGIKYVEPLGPPTPEVPPAKKYAAFVSHKKSEAAAEARYIHDQLELLLSTDIFLDSSKLLDLRGLFEQGLAQSEVLLFLASTSVLHSPWCLLELYQASKLEVPVVVVAVDTWDSHAALAFLSNLEERLQAVNPSGFDELLKRLHDLDVMSDVTTGTTIDAFAQTVIRVLHLQDVTHLTPDETRQRALHSLQSRSTSSSINVFEHTSSFPRPTLTKGQSSESNGGATSLLEFHMHASDHQLIATMVAIAERMAAVTGRGKLSWDYQRGRRSLAGNLQDLHHLAGNLRNLGLADGKNTWQRCDCCTELCGGDIATETPNDFKLFIACDTEDPLALGTARFLQIGLQRKLDAPVVMEQPPADTDELGQDHQEKQGRLSALLDEGVLSSESMVLLLTAGVLQRPTTMLQVFEALRSGRALTTVLVSGGGYDFASTRSLLRSLGSEEVARRGHTRGTSTSTLELMHSLLNERNASLQEMQGLLADAIPNIISIPFNPQAHVKQKDAAIAEIAMRLSSADKSDGHPNESPFHKSVTIQTSKWTKLGGISAFGKIKAPPQNKELV